MADRTRGAHSAPRAARRARSYKFVAGAAALGIAVLLLVGGQGTFAYWNDSATVSGTGFTAGKLDLTVANSQQGTTANPYVESTLAVSAMLPGETIASTIAINNAGDADFTWSPTVASTSGVLGPALVVKFFSGGSTTGQRVSYPRNQTCTGTPVTSGATAGRVNRAAASQTLCVQVTLPLDANNDLQGKTGSFTIGVNAAQALVAAP